MSYVLATSAAGGCHLFSGCGFPSPSINDFYFTPFFKVGSVGFGKPGLLMLLSTALVLLFFWFAFRSPKLVPRGIQNVGEMGILFVRDQILRPQLGKRGEKWLPFLVSLFFFIWINNIMGIIPILYFPAMSKYGYPVALAGMVWFIYIGLGIKHQGLVGYFKSLTIPSGSPTWILPLLIPIEFFSNVLVRPFTLSVRLFANMLAGHVLLLVFTLATWYLLTVSAGALHSAVGVASAAVSFIVTILVTALEVLVQALQAFIFTILTATYISGAYEAH
ncbi:MAG TPA: F0F1 ATP synthase subunit A [Streptosporangiaceae bacterium]|nr:F0F1 ATP synthase subunit A [Streptosporangiaceae bacterium]